MTGVIRSSLVGWLLFSVIVWPMTAYATTDFSFLSRASTRTGKLVALGDSITFGYNLGNNHGPSHKAFPYLLGKQQNLSVSDLGVPGWTSAQLLHAVKTNSAMQSSIQSAKIITVDIGSNDLLQTAFKNGQSANQTINVATVKPKLKATVVAMKHHIDQILTEIRKLNSDAVVIVYNLYDPISPKNESLHSLAEYTIQAANLAIAETAVAHKDPIADAYDALHNYQADILPGGVHPTVKGQTLLATQGVAALDVQKINQFLQSPKAQSQISSWLNNPTF